MISGKKPSRETSFHLQFFLANLWYCFQNDKYCVFLSCPCFAQWSGSVLAEPQATATFFQQNDKAHGLFVGPFLDNTIVSWLCTLWEHEQLRVTPSKCFAVGLSPVTNVLHREECVYRCIMDRLRVNSLMISSDRISIVNRSFCSTESPIKSEEVL